MRISGFAKTFPGNDTRRAGPVRCSTCGWRAPLPGDRSRRCHSAGHRGASCAATMTDFLRLPPPAGWYIAYASVVGRFGERVVMAQSRLGEADAPGDQSLTDSAYEQLEELIVTLQLPPGMVLSELALSARLGIGRTPIREALQRLARDGLVNILPRRGVLVSDIDLRAQLRLLEVRRELERLLSRRAAERATVEERAVFTQLATDMRAAAAIADDLAFMRLDLQFNELVSATARNEFASRSIGLMHGLSRRFWYQHYREAADLPLTARLHAEVAEAIAARDGDAAAAASDRLVGYIESFARSTL